MIAAILGFMPARDRRLSIAIGKARAAVNLFRENLHRYEVIHSGGIHNGHSLVDCNS